jgi:hypothetical protein
MNRRCLIFAALLLFAAACAAVDRPIVLYTDLLSGPNDGGENGNGCYLSIFGKNLGEASGLGSLTKVFIGGVEVSSYRYLGPSRGRPDIQQLTLQVGHLGNPKPGVGLPIEVRVGGLQSQSFTSQTFTVNPGRILFVSLAGDDKTAVAGDIKHPWRHLQTSTEALTGAWGAARPGDVIVMREGLWTDIGFGSHGRIFFVQFFGNSGTGPKGTANSGPISISAYPKEEVIIHPPFGTVYGLIGGLNSTQVYDASGNPQYSQWITISNLTIATGGINDGPINLETNSNYWRVINNDLSAPDAVSNRAAGVTGNGKKVAVLGNRIHDIAGVGSRGETLLDHGIYIDSGSQWELAYNFIEHITGGNGIQLYNSGHVTKTIDDVNIHHNWIHDINKHGINIADTSGVGIFVWDNVVYKTVGGCWRNNSVDLQNAKIWNNTFYDCNTADNFGAIWNDVKNPTIPISLDFKNNIVCSSHAGKKYAGGETGFIAEGVRAIGTRNLWCGLDDHASTAFATDSMFADPGFVSVDAIPDFHLQRKSPAISSGDIGIIPEVTSNYDLVPIVKGAKVVNRGAF